MLGQQYLSYPVTHCHTEVSVPGSKKRQTFEYLVSTPRMVSSFIFEITFPVIVFALFSHGVQEDNPRTRIMPN